MASLTFSSYMVRTTMTFNSQHGNKGYEYPPTGSYELYVKTSNNAKQAAKRTTITTGPRIRSSSMGLSPQTQQLTGYFHTVNGQSANTIQKLHTAALTLSSRPFPCVNNILLPGMILTVTAGSDIFPEFPSSSTWMVDQFKVDQNISKGFSAYECEIILMRYYGNLE